MNRCFRVGATEVKRLNQTWFVKETQEYVNNEGWRLWTSGYRGRRYSIPDRAEKVAVLYDGRVFFSDDPQEVLYVTDNRHRSCRTGRKPEGWKDINCDNHPSLPGIFEYREDGYWCARCVNEHEAESHRGES